MILVLNHFRSHVLQSSAKSVSLLHVVRLDTPSKIANLDYVSIFYQNVFWLDIPMNQALLVQIVDARANLNEEVECCILAEELFFPYKIKEVTLGGVLERQINCRFILETGVETADILMVQLLLDPDLPNQRLLDLAATQTLLFYFFNRDLDPRGLVPSELNFPVRSLAQVGLSCLDEL
jgi:hypothetical protein